MNVDKEQERTLQKRLEAYTSRTVRMKLNVDPLLQGGVVVQIGDTVLDGSVRHQLNVLKNRFIAGGTL
jgi:F-type H+-transporting ATPase subunit delta